MFKNFPFSHEFCTNGGLYPTNFPTIAIDIERSSMGKRSKTFLRMHMSSILFYPSVARSSEPQYMHYLVSITSLSMPLGPPSFNATLSTIYIYIYKFYISGRPRHFVPGLQITHVQNDFMYWIFYE